MHDEDEEPMRYLLVGPAHPLRGGIATFNGRLFRYLEQRGHQVRAINFKRQYPSFLFPGRTQEDHSRQAIRVPAPRVLDAIGPASWLRAAQLAHAFDPDVVVYHHWMPFFAPCYASLGALIRVAGRAKNVWICHNLTPHERQPGSDVLNFLGLATAHGFMVMSEAVERDLLRLRPKARYRRVMHPADEPTVSIPQAEARRRLRLPDGKPILLFFGYVRAYKGLDVLLRALPLVLREAEVVLVVAGEFYEPRDQFERLARELGVEKAVVWRDEFIPNEEVALFFSACDAVVLPYRTATQSGIVPLAYSHRKPIVTTSVGGLVEAVRDGATGILAPPEDPEALAQAILRFLALRERVRWEENIAEVHRLMSWGRFVDALEDLVSELRVS